MLEAIGSAIDSRRDDLVSLTRELIRIPTVNPPGEGYRECCDHLAARLVPQGFEATFVRAEGTPGDTDRYPRWNVVLGARDACPAPACISTPISTWWRPAPAGRLDPVRRRRSRAKNLRPRRLRHEGRPRRLHHRGGGVPGAFPDYPGAIEISGTADEETGGYGGVAYLAEKGILAKPRIDHVIIPEPLNKDRICLGHRGVWWAEIETHGRIAHGSMPFLGDCAIRHMGAVLDALRDRALSGARRAPHRHAGGARRRAAVDHEHQFHAWRARKRVSPASPPPASPIPAAWSSTAAT